VTRWLAVIGIGEEGIAGLLSAAQALVETAQLLVGGPRHLAMVPPNGSAERLAWDRPLARTVETIAAWRGRRVVVLASGDPLWYGVGAVLVRRFPHAEMTILPQPSAFSLTAARLGWPLAECAAISLHARPLDTLRLQLMPGRRVLALSEDGGTPSAAAALLSRLGWGPSRLTVCSHLGGPHEAVVSADAQDWGERRVPDLNTLALECRAGPGAQVFSRIAGLPDDAFEHDGQLTKREVRAATLAALAPLTGESLWDVGAGCGSIAIEWLRAGEGCTAVAVERDPARAARIARNAASLGVPELRVIIGKAPEALVDLAPPDAIFIGGGINTPDLLPAMWAALRPGGRLVANVISIEGEVRLFEWQARYGGCLTRIGVSRAEPAGTHHLWRPFASVTQLSATKPA
jgi:precorrin-6B C5,15-methyltransferase / cobalt-precorrin-6B C5,C15-methyltransferase